MRSESIIANRSKHLSRYHPTLWVNRNYKSCPPEWGMTRSNSGVFSPRLRNNGPKSSHMYHLLVAGGKCWGRLFSWSWKGIEVTGGQDFFSLQLEGAFSGTPMLSMKVVAGCIQQRPAAPAAATKFQSLVSPGQELLGPKFEDPIIPGSEIPEHF